MNVSNNQFFMIKPGTTSEFHGTTINHDSQYNHYNPHGIRDRELELTDRKVKKAPKNEFKSPEKMKNFGQEVQSRYVPFDDDHKISPINIEGKHRQETQSSKEEEEEKGQFNPLKIPADWDLAAKHAKARRVAKELPPDESGKERERCPCCGYEIERQELSFFINVMELAWMGSGFPLFYNFIVYCIFILFEQLTIKNGYNLVTNIVSGYCQQTFPESTPDDEKCPNTWIHISITFTYFLHNKSNPYFLHIQEYLGLLLIVVVMVTLLFFRASQNAIDVEIDDLITSPADYTLCVKNIPRNLECDYKKEIKRIFTEFAVPNNQGSKIVVTKIVLVHDIEEIIKKEQELDKTVKAKQNFLHENYCNFGLEKVKEFDEQIEDIEKEIHQIEKFLEDTNEKFTGIAFISFQTEAMKAAVLEANPFTQLERIRSFLNDGKLPNLPEDTLAWEGHKLFIELAPEPNDVDWEFIHCSTKEKIKYRIYSNLLSALFIFACFALLYVISFWKAKLSDQANEEAAIGKINPTTLLKVNILSFIVSWTIVIFNKFVIGKVLHYIVDIERISNKTKFNISYAQKLSIGLFINTACLSYIIDILILQNFIGQGGFIQNETQVFILNALFPPFVWLMDPWGKIKDFARNQELQDIAQSTVTQEEANFIAESCDYLQSKRYSDIMKTMWFTFLYGGAIPLGTVFSICGLILYYYIDKYNLLNRRTIKESLAKDLSIEMIEFLEMIILFNGIGNLTVAYDLFAEVHWQDILILIAAIVYSVAPMEELSQKLFPVEESEETKTYEEVVLDFDTDYDKENPVTRKKALREWKKLVKEKEEKLKEAPKHQAHHQILYNQDNEGYNFFKNH